jgi:hypothetical protein
MPFQSDSESERLNQQFSTTSPTNYDNEPEIEMVYIQENEMLNIKDNDRPKGSFYMLPMRTASDKMYYGTGVAYLCGLTYGGVFGTIRGLQKAPVNRFKVQWSSVVNQTTRYGPWAANSLGVMTFAWAAIDSAFASVRETDDYINHVGAAFTSGVLFKSTAGLRPAVLTGTILGAAVMSYGVITDAFSKKPSFRQLSSAAV